MMFWYFDPSYLLFMLPGLVLSLLAQWYVSSTFRRFARVPLSTGLVGAEVAAAVLRGAGVADVAIREVEGFLGDHYDPSTKVLRLQLAFFAIVLGLAMHLFGLACLGVALFALLLLFEQAPVAYKDVERVVDVVDVAGIARKAARLVPIGVVKG